MKRDVQKEESFIFAIHNMRHKVNEIVVILPFLFALAFSIIGAPIIIGVCDLSAWLIPPMIVGPILLVLIFYTVRKRIIINSFIQIRDVRDRVELTDILASDLENMAKGRVFMFAYSEYMEIILYNWLHSLKAIRAEKLKMYKVFYDNYAPVYLAVCEEDLSIPEESRDNYQKETGRCLNLSDMQRGKAVNQKLYSRISKENERR